MIANATDAPKPTLPVVVEPAPTGRALVVDVDVDVAVTDTSPGGTSTTGPSIVAVVVRFTISRASEPATLTPPDPAPLDAAAPNTCLPAAPPAPGVIVAETTKPVAFAIFAVDGTLAVFVTFASVIATPAPIPALDAADADPSALLDAAVAAELANVTTPPEVITSPEPSSATVEPVVARSIPTAAATEIFPSEVDADGDAAVPDPLPPLASATASALSR